MCNLFYFIYYKDLFTFGLWLIFNNIFVYTFSWDVFFSLKKNCNNSQNGFILFVFFILFYLLFFCLPGLVSEQKSKVEEKRALRTDPTSQNSLRSHLRFIRVTQDGQLHTGRFFFPTFSNSSCVPKNIVDVKWTKGIWSYLSGAA